MTKVILELGFQTENSNKFPTFQSNPKTRHESKQAGVSAQQPWEKVCGGLNSPKKSLTKRFERSKKERGDSDNEGVFENVPFKKNERLRCVESNERRPSFSDTESVLEITNMPVGTTNSILKTSFSLTSLRSSTPTDSPEHGAQLRLKTERPYHSLTKKSRDSTEQNKESWRKSWGSGISQDGKEFWEGFQADYDYLMAQNILDRDLSGSTPTAPPVWSHSEFMDHFAQLYSWLKGIQESVYCKPENVTDWKLRAERQEEMQRQRFRLDNLNEESKKLISRFPEAESEVGWRVKHINEKWETVETMMGGWRKAEGEKVSQISSMEKVQHEVKCLRKWLRELDGKLKPLSFHQGWTKPELEIKMKEHMVLHRDIEGHRKIVSSIVKLCESTDSQKLLVAARAFERKYHENYLRSLEWQCLLEKLVGLQLNKSSSTLSNDSDGEPVAKIGRFTYDEDVEEVDHGCEFVNLEDSRKGSDCSMDSDLVAKGERSLAAMVGGKVERSDESISGNRDSAMMVGTKPKNANVFFSVANSATESAPICAEKSVRAPCFGETHGQDDQDFSAVKKVGISPKLENVRPKPKPPNTGSFTWTHLDTDSEQEKIMSKKEGKTKRASNEVFDGKDAETTSSEDGWTYLSGPQTEAEVQKKPKAAVRLDFKKSEGLQGNSETKQIKYFSAKNIPRSDSKKLENNKEPISSSYRKLVDLADEFVRCKSKSWKSRRLRKKLKEGEESCDASEECTTEDSDGRACESSEEGEGGGGGRRRSAETAAELTAFHRALSEDFMRGRKRSLRSRPWSMSSMLWLKTPRSPSLKSRSSVSESALNQMDDQFDKSRSLNSTPNKSSRTLCADDWSGSFIKRRKIKMRRKMSKKSESGSDAVTLSGSDSSRVSPKKQISNSSGLVKSGSFSGVTRRQKEFSVLDKFESATATETDEEPGLAPPVFRLGPEAGAVSVASEQEKCQLEEQLSLNWDNYQEKYQSEASGYQAEEPPDSDTAKKLLEFGEDYGKFLGNLSDCPSGRSRSTAGRSRSKLDSDSDVDEVRRILRQSRDQLDLWEFRFNKTIGGLISATDLLPDEFVSKTFFDEIIGACKRNVDCLSKVLEEVKDEALLAKEHKYVQNLLESWDGLKARAELQKAKQLQKDMALLKKELLDLAVTVDATETTVTSKEELEAKITQIQNELNLMKKGKSKLLQANVSVHRFLSSAKSADPSLRDEVTELYQVWDQTFCRISSQLFHLQSMSQTWHDFEDHLAQLQCALRTDTLKVLDFALKCGKSSSSSSFSLQEIANLLSDRDSSKSSLEVEEWAAEKDRTPLLTVLSTEGSFSDSGISDSGSEQELSEREKRLAQLKRLVKRLETILAPGSQALSNMFKRLEQAETELRELQKTCRDLIVRSASGEETKILAAKTSASVEAEAKAKAEPPSEASSGKKVKRRVLDEAIDKGDGSEGTCDGGKSGKKYWFWRLLRFALPFQLALVTLLCVACMMEPRCCDSLNNLSLSLNPQVRYDFGPPPV